MEKLRGGYLGKKAQVGWGTSNGFEEWMGRAGIFYIWFIQDKNAELLLLGGAFKSQKPRNTGPGDHSKLTWVHPPYLSRFKLLGPGTYRLRGSDLCSLAPVHHDRYPARCLVPRTTQASFCSMLQPQELCQLKGTLWQRYVCPSRHSPTSSPPPMSACGLSCLSCGCSSGECLPTHRLPSPASSLSRWAVRPSEGGRAQTESGCPDSNLSSSHCARQGQTQRWMLAGRGVNCPLRGLVLVSQTPALRQSPGLFPATRSAPSRQQFPSPFAARQARCVCLSQHIPSFNTLSDLCWASKRGQSGTEPGPKSHCCGLSPALLLLALGPLARDLAFLCLVFLDS